MGTLTRLPLPRLGLGHPETRVCRGCGRQFETDRALLWACEDCNERSHRLTFEQARQERAARRQALLAGMGLVGRLTEMSLDVFDADFQEEAYIAAVEFVDAYPESPNLALLGGPGSGKTHLAVGIVLALAQEGVYGRYVSLPALVLSLNAAPERAEAERNRLEPLLSVPVLVLDDCGREKLTPHLSSWLDRIFDARWVARLPSIMTANLTNSELMQWLGGASASRLQANWVPIAMRKGDQRRPTAQRPAVRKIDPLEPCPECQDAGWVVDSTRLLAGPNLVRCPRCKGRIA